MDEKDKKFKEFAEYRTNQALKYIRLLGNLSNKRAYQYTQTQVDKIVSTLNKEITNLKRKLSSGSEEDKSFKL
tara:strand:+ start:56 stop:274 length:219 start_codon:yes stop_codon:yes gene_type:complete